MPSNFNPKIKIIIGLGNPDQKYQNTYHNIGHLFVASLKKTKKTLPYLIFPTQSYMNQSGPFVKNILKKNKIKPEELLLVHDDADIALGKYKLQFGRGSAGHKGVESVIKNLKTKNFWRLRIGIRKNHSSSSAGGERLKAEKLVLQKISSSDQKILKEVFQKIKENLL